MNRFLTILLADDNEDDVVLTREAFEAAGGNRIEVVEDGEAALAYLRRKGKFKSAPAPDVILLDINMPKKDGFDVLKEIKADADLRRLPVVIFTTSNRDLDIDRAYLEGACSFVIKPLGFDQYVDFARNFSRYWSAISQVPKNRNGHRWS